MEERARHVQGSSQTKYCAPQKPSFEYDLDQVSFHLVLQCCGCCDTLGLIKAFPELSWDFTSKIKVGLSLRQILSPCHCLESYPPRWLQLSNCCAHHGTLEVGAKTLQTVKVHIKVCSLQGRPAIFSPQTDMEPELYNVPALFFVLNELVDELVGLQLPNVCLSVKGP